MDIPKISKKGVEKMEKLINKGNDPLSKKINRVKKEAQKNVMKMFSVDGDKSNQEDK